MLAVLAVLVVANVVLKAGPAATGLVVGPLAASALIVLARRRGLTWTDLGLGRRTRTPGLRYAAGLIAAVAVVYAVAATVPATRPAFLDDRYRMDAGAALLTAFVVIPLGTILLEEVAFRGVLPALVARHHGMRRAMLTSSLLFGLWHVLPSLRLGRVNPAVAAVAGDGAAAQVLVVCGAVVFTSLAGLLLCELRRRSGSLLAPAGLHWAVNALGVLAGLLVRHRA